MGAKVGHIDIMGKDGKKLQDFYAKLFDWKVDADNPMALGMVKREDAGISVAIGTSEPGEPNRVSISVAVQDVDAYLKKAVELGGKVMMEPTDMGSGARFAMFADPEGNVVGVGVLKPAGV